MAIELPQLPTDEAELDDLLSTPDVAVIQSLAEAAGPIVLLGAGGKVGPSLALMARRALDAAGSNTEVIAVSRWSDERSRTLLEDGGIRTLSADLADPDVYADLPDAGSLFFLVGHKFGASADSARTWWMNAIVPSLAAARYRGVPSVVYSTGNVYPFRPMQLGGATEATPPAPIGDYAQSRLAREQVFRHAATTWGTRADNLVAGIEIKGRDRHVQHGRA